MMRLVNQAGRLHVVFDGVAVDVERASGGGFSPDPQAVYARWDEFRAWAADVDYSNGHPVDKKALAAPVPRPGQVFAIGVNYRDHVEEAGIDMPTEPFVFTKFPASVAGPYDEIELTSDSVDFEVELVAVIGRRARRVPAEQGWQHVAGLTVGQDLSDRRQQLSGPAPQQYSLGKSFAGFSPVGPALVTVDEFADPNDLEICAFLSGQEMQRSRTKHLIFPVPDIIAFLSAKLPLWPGDLIFTGTPSGIGWTRQPQRLITAQDELVSYIEGIGEMRHRFRGPVVAVVD
jgi:2-keto-4-pentenoate hydratase/2-oxohepta-3-ene-1,7-dioic acid hydratase in catechol pathway